MPKKKTWGGKRSGAGRRESGRRDEWKKVLSIRLPGHLIERLRSEGKPADIIEKLLNDYFLGPVSESPEVSKPESVPEVSGTRELPNFESEFVEKALIVQPEARRQALVSIRELRVEMGIKDRSFDSAILRLSAEQKIFLHKHIHPYRLTEKDKEELVTDGKGNYYVGVVLRGES